MKKTMAFVLLLIAGIVAIHSQELTILTEDSGLANRVDEKGNLVGYATEVVREILRRQGQADTIKVYPWARAYLMLEQLPDVVLFSTTMTEERRDKFKWVGPLIVIDWALYKQRGLELTVVNLEDARKAKGIAVIKGDAKEKYLLDRGFTNVVPLTNVLSCLRMVQAGRTDLWMTTNRGITAAALQAGVDPALFEKALTVRESYLYIAFSRDTSDEIVKQWRTTFENMQHDGTYERIMIENGGEDVMVLPQ